jgi:molecular chaperone DnaK
MRVDAESHAEEDRRRMEEVEARNRLDGLVYQAEKTIRENREKLPEADVKSAEEALEGAKKAMSDGGGTAALRSATENVERALHKLAETLYKSGQEQQAEAASAGAGAGQAGPSGSQGGAQSGGNKPGDVIDAEYVDVDENKRPN